MLCEVLFCDKFHIFFNTPHKLTFFRTESIPHHCTRSGGKDNTRYGWAEWREAEGPDQSLPTADSWKRTHLARVVLEYQGNPKIALEREGKEADSPKPVPQKVTAHTSFV